MSENNSFQVVQGFIWQGNKVLPGHNCWLCREGLRDTGSYTAERNLGPWVVDNRMRSVLFGVVRRSTKISRGRCGRMAGFAFAAGFGARCLDRHNTMATINLCNAVTCRFRV